MKRTIIALASILAIVAGCAKDSFQASVSESGIKATIESLSATKATLCFEGREGSNFLVWQAEDSFSLFDGVSNVKCTLSSNPGGVTGQFTSESEPAVADTYYAIYPYSSSNVLNEGAISIFYPDCVVYDPETGLAESGENGRANLMVAKQGNTDIKFKNLCSYLYLTITGDASQKVASISVLPKDMESTVAGTATVTFDGDEPSIAFTGTYTSNSEDVIFSEPVSLAEPLSVKVAVAPVYTEGFNVLVTLEDGSYQIIGSDNAIGRNRILAMPAFEFSGVEVAEIGGTGYTSIAAAVAAANASPADVTVKLLDDAFAPQTLEINNPAAKVTLDFNGYTISSESYPSVITATDCVLDGKTAGGGISGTVVRCVSGTLEIKGGTYCGDYKSQGVIAVIQEEGAHAQVIIDETSEPVVEADGQAALFIKGGRMIIKSGKFLNSEKYVLYSYDQDTVLISGGLFQTEGAYYAIMASAPDSYEGGRGLVQFDGGKVVSTTKSALYAGRYHDLTVNAGDFISDSSVCFQGYLTGDLRIYGGYFYTNNPDLKTAIGGNYAKALGGNYNTVVEEKNLWEGYVCEPSAVAGPEGRNYTHKVVENTKPIVSLTVGGVSTNYSAFADALEAAVAATEDPVIRLLDDVVIKQSLDFTNDNSKTVTLDMNSFTLSSTTVRNLITTTGVLNIVDNSVEKKGMITGTVNRIIYLKSAGTINVSDITIETSATNYTTTIDSSAIAVHGADADNNAAKFTATNATIRTADGKRTSIFGVIYAKVELDGCVITSGPNGEGNGYYNIKASSGAKVTATNTSFYSASGTNIHCLGSAGSASISVENCWFYSGGASNFSTSKGNSYDKIITAKSCYFNQDTRAAYSNWKVASGQSWGRLDPAVKHEHKGRGEQEYKYAVAENN